LDAGFFVDFFVFFLAAAARAVFFVVFFLGAELERVDFLALSPPVRRCLEFVFLLDFACFLEATERSPLGVVKLCTLRV
jgi:hypothetical protein